MEALSKFHGHGDIQAIDQDVGALEKRVWIILRYPVGKESDIDFRIDVEKLLLIHIDFLSSEVAYKPTPLPIRVWLIEDTRIGQTETTNPHTGHKNRLSTTDATTAGNGESLIRKQRDSFLS